MEKPLSSYGKVIVCKKNKVKRNLRKYKFEIEREKIKYILNQMCVCCFGYLCGTISIFGSFNPIGIACIATFLGSGIRFYIVLLATFLGYMTRPVFGVEIYVIAICFCIAIETFHFFKKSTTLKYKGIVGGIGVLVGVVGFLFINGVSTFIVVRGLAEAICIVGFCEIMKKSLFLFDGGISKKILNEGHIMCMGVMSVILIGAVSLMNGLGPYIGAVFGICFLLIGGFKAGIQVVALGALAGLFLMILQVITMENFIVICSATLLAGVFNEKRVYTVLAFFVGAVMPAFYINSLPTHSFMLGFVLGGILFLIMPTSFLDSINTYQNHKEEFESRDYFIKIKELMQIKLNAFAEVFGSLTNAFEVQEVPKKISLKDAMGVVEKISDNVCEQCNMWTKCWEEKDYATYEGIHNLIGAVNENGKAEIQNLTAWIKENCVKKEELINFSNMYGREYKNNLVWENRLNSYKKLLKEQLICVEQIIKEVPLNPVFQPVFYESTAKEIKEKLVKRGIKVEKVYVAVMGKEGFSVSITKSACYSNKQCKTDILPVVNSVIGKKLVLVERECTIDKNGTCTISYKEQRGYRLKTAVAAIKEKGSETSGDAYYYDETEEKKGILVLCDGMGSGVLAEKESSKGVNLVKGFVKAGFPLDIAMKSLNSVLGAGRSGDMYTTMDVCSIDLYSGETEIIKNGGASIFVVKDGKIKIVRSSSLPMGILKEWQGEVTCFELKRGDTIIMVTDGVTDSFGIENEEKGIVQALKKEDKNLNELATEILRLAMKENGGSAKDDMTVLIGKIY